MEYTPQLLEDMTALRKELVRRGWVSGELCEWITEDGGRAYKRMSLNDDDDGAYRPDFTQGPVCMTGAVGAAIEGADFLQWAWDLDVSTPSAWGWSPRGAAVIEALLTHLPEWMGTECYTDASIGSCVDSIVDCNDGTLETQDRALEWVDFVIRAVTERLPAKAPVVKPPDLAWVAKAAPARQPELA